MTWIIPIFSLINIILAFIDSRIIRDGNKILHGLNGVVYLVLVALAVWYTGNYWLIGALLTDRLLFFNIPLSLFRGLVWNYISPAPVSVVDRMAKAVFGNRGSLMYGVYAVGLITFIIIIYAI